MANKKYVIMRNPKGGVVCPVLPSEDNHRIKAYQKNGYKIIGRMSCNDRFKPDYVVSDTTTKHSEHVAGIEVK